MLVQNTLFRVGGSAVLLSSRPRDSLRAKFKLLHTIRVQEASDASAAAVVQTEDSEGFRGVALSKEITRVAGRALRENLALLAPKVLP
jgi:3-ketoacyl-CoA synthase